MKEVDSISRVIGIRLLMLMFWLEPELEEEAAAVAAALAISEMSAAVVASVRAGTVELWATPWVPVMVARREWKAKTKKMEGSGLIGSDYHEE
jgi:hypothetical protein